MKLLWASWQSRGARSNLNLEAPLGSRMLILLAIGTLGLFASNARAEIATLKNGMQYEGRPGKIASLGEDPLALPGAGGDVKIKQIVFLDDDLRRTFFSSMQTQSLVPNQITLEKIRIDQRVAHGNRRVAAVGPIIRITPFDEWGRRILTMSTREGPLDIVQGITEVSPVYTKAEALLTRNAYVWDMRIATSSIPRETLSKVLMGKIDPQDPDDRLRLVRLYIQAERYTDARQELESVIAAFPEMADLKKQVAALYQLSARRLIGEIEQRRSAGQHRLAYGMLSQFPSEGVAGEILVRVRDMLQEYHQRKAEGDKAIAELDQLVPEVQNAESRAEAEAVSAEIKAELNLHTFDRLADFLRLSSDDKLTAEQKVALAVSGWLQGSGSGSTNLAVALSLVDVRRLVRQYLNAEHPHEREAILQELQTLEGGTAAEITKLLAQMKPAVDTAAEEDALPGFYRLQVKGTAEQSDFEYLLQLPPEYDPYRRYPCVVTLNGAGTTPEQQIDWWAGEYAEAARTRLGQATRRGYITVAPVWTKPHQREYEYSSREHAAVLFSLRDACRRFAIDTDRVFLSGHSMGGDAAWDIGLSHPDLWAGVMPIVATADKYISRYWENARRVALYFVAGEMDGDRMARNSLDLDRYLTHSGFDTTVVVYAGRGHEHFQDEIQRLFDWMDLHRRDFFPREFNCVSMRPWDSFFWWAEIGGLPSRSLVLPVNWPPDAGVRPTVTEGRILENNRVSLTTGGDRATVWLSPEMVDFNQRVSVSVDRRVNNQAVEPSVEVLLEDVRTRGDRQHPFWAKVESASRR